jgi:sugar phosphate isomerase/epimerase
MFKNLSTDVLGVSGTSSEIVESALSYGFKGLEFSMADFAAQVSAGGLAKARRFYDSAKLRLTVFDLPVEWHEDTDRYKADLAALPAQLEIAKELGCTRALVTIEPAGDMRPFHENFEFHRRRLAELAGLVEPFGIQLGVRFLAPASLRQGRAFQFIQTVDQFLMLIRGVNAKNLGVVFDSWHWHLGGGTIEQLRSLSGDQVVAVYLSDCDPHVSAADATDAARHMPTEAGVIDCVAYLSALGEMSYTGPVTPAASRGSLGNQGRDKVIKAASAAIDQVWKAAGLNSQGKLLATAK